MRATNTVSCSKCGSYTGCICLTTFTLPSVPQGWQCPICKIVNAPHAPACLNCKPQEEPV